MISVVCNFYNEEYLLPYWLDHHGRLFDYGVMIDWNSTDNSVEIIKKKVPHWKIVKSKYEFFHREDVDREVISYENELNGWKCSLNVTEFVFHYDLRQYLYCLDKNINGIWLPPIVPVTKEIQLNYDLPKNSNLLTLFDYGIFYKNCIRPTNRLIYKTKKAEYNAAGRHTALLENTILTNDIFHVWTGFFPWNNKLINRKLQQQNRMTEQYKKSGDAGEHFLNRKELFKRYLLARSLSYDLNSNPVIKTIMWKINNSLQCPII